MMPDGARAPLVRARRARVGAGGADRARAGAGGRTAGGQSGSRAHPGRGAGAMRGRAAVLGCRGAGAAPGAAGGRAVGGARGGAGDAGAAAADRSAAVVGPVSLRLGRTGAGRGDQSVPLHPGRPAAGVPARRAGVSAHQPGAHRTHDLSADGRAGVPSGRLDRARGGRDEGGDAGVRPDRDRRSAPAAAPCRPAGGTGARLCLGADAAVGIRGQRPCRCAGCRAGDAGAACRRAGAARAGRACCWPRPAW